MEAIVTFMDNIIAPELSVIVPVYNVEKCLEKCIESILNQTFKNYELILVDDGSPDNSGKICDEYAKKYSKIRVIHKKNGGLSQARNVGISVSKGEYLSFIDSDDYIASDMFEFLMKNLKENNADVSVCGIYDCYKDKIVHQCKDQKFLILDNETALSEALIGKNISVNAVNKIYKKELFDNIKFPDGKLFEDAFTIPKILSISKKVVADTKPLYYYQHRVGTITTSSFKKQDLSVIEAYDEVLKLVLSQFPNLKKQAEFRHIWSYMHVLDKMILSENFEDFDECSKVLKFLRKNTGRVILNPYFSLKRKISTIILFFSKTFYEMILKYNKKQNTNLFE